VRQRGKRGGGGGGKPTGENEGRDQELLQLRSIERSLIWKKDESEQQGQGLREGPHDNDGLKKAQKKRGKKNLESQKKKKQTLQRNVGKKRRRDGAGTSAPKLEKRREPRSKEETREKEAKNLRQNPKAGSEPKVNIESRRTQQWGENRGLSDNPFQPEKRRHLVSETPMDDKSGKRISHIHERRKKRKKSKGKIRTIIASRDRLWGKPRSRAGVLSGKDKKKEH